MFWDCIVGESWLCKIDRRMDAKLYVGILKDQLQESLNYYKKKPRNIFFQQNNDPKHKSKMAVWPPQSTNLNSIEHLWHYLKKKLRESVMYCDIT